MTGVQTCALPILKLPVPIVKTELLTTADPIFKSNGERLAVEELFEIFINTEFANTLTVLLPILISVVVNLTLAPTFAPSTKLPVLTDNIEVLTENEPTENPLEFTFTVYDVPDNVIELLFEKTLTVLFPILIPDVVKLTLEPTLAPVLKLPVLVAKIGRAHV